jgi:hypothetical protein
MPVLIMHHKKTRDSRKYQSVRQRLSRAYGLSTDHNNLFTVHDEAGVILASGKISRETFSGREGFYVKNIQLEARRVLDVRTGTYLSDRRITIDTREKYRV